MRPRRCPCGTGLPLADCCGRLHDGTATAAHGRAADALAVQRLRPSATPSYLLDDLAPDHPPARARPRRRTSAGPGWTCSATTGGSLLGAEGTVEFRAHYLRDGAAGSQHENSRFVREDGLWRYLDGVSLT